MAALPSLRHILSSRSHIFIGWFAASILSLPRVTFAQAGAEEYALKAAFIHNFTFFIEWPSTVLPKEIGFFNVCLWKSDPSRGVFDVFEERSYKEVPFRLAKVSTTSEVLRAPCHILFIPNATKELGVAAELATRPVLTVCDRPAPECIIELLLVERKVRFKIRNEKAKRASIVVRAQLLNLALPE